MARRVWRWLGVLWLLAGTSLSLFMLSLGVDTVLDLGWRGRAAGAFAVAGVAAAMTVLGGWTIRAEFRPQPPAERS
jgi:hypothetical protein